MLDGWRAGTRYSSRIHLTVLPYGNRQRGAHLTPTRILTPRRTDALFSGVFYPPQQYVYPGAVGPSPVVYVPRYPAPAESGNEQGSSSGGQPGWGSYFPSNWQSWGSNWGSYFPSWPGSGPSESAEGATPGTPAQGNRLLPSTYGYLCYTAFTVTVTIPSISVTCSRFVVADSSICVLGHQQS